MDDMASTTTGNISERRAHWRALVADWKASGLSQARFCRERELPVWKLRYWAKRVAASEEAESSQAFAAVSSPGSGLRLTLPGGASLEMEPGFDEATLLRFLRVAGAAC